MELSSWVRIIVVTNFITEGLGILFYGSVLIRIILLGGNVLEGGTIIMILSPLLTYIIEVPVNVLMALGLACTKPKWTLPCIVVQFISFLLYMLLILFLLLLMVNNETGMINLTHAFLFMTPKYVVVDGEPHPLFSTQVIARYGCLLFILVFIIIAGIKLWSAAALREHKRVTEFQMEAKEQSIVEK